MLFNLLGRVYFCPFGFILGWRRIQVNEHWLMVIKRPLGVAISRRGMQSRAESLITRQCYAAKRAALNLWWLAVVVDLASDFSLSCSTCQGPITRVSLQPDQLI